MSSLSPATKPRHAWLYALPRGRMPDAVRCGGERFEHVRTFKHDFFAATGLYRGPSGLAVLKMGRVNDALSIPLAWIGEFLTRREAEFYERLQDLENVPRFIGRVGRNGLLHAYVPGHALERHEPVSDTFFDELLATVRALHDRGMAYVDLNKRQNVLMGDDGRPYLIDFQISLAPPRGWLRFAPVRFLLAHFQHGDWYHCLKHKRRLRPELLTDEERAALEKLSLPIRLHRWLTRPLTNLRRRTLKRLSASENVRVAGADAK